ncbi:mate-domain-containing protein [Polychytrium aggregatum]|uniref:mate-domain-containing protein n=1 Tax=Polychytrium aggregatum TaxID=110093 RepID=UPI0022FE669E|nr:mate-domain-containing protein [Polychytrium aggregatum]KAI9197449.1 mate-domain-containing protein [Polychytrium aggregatum]
MQSEQHPESTSPSAKAPPFLAEGNLSTDSLADEATALLSQIQHIDSEPVVTFEIWRKEVKQIRKLAWPISAGSLLQMSLGLTTVFSLGHLGTKELASGSLAFMFCNITGFSIGVGMSTALDTLCSQAHTGSKDPHALGKHLQRGLVVMAGLFIPVAILWFFTDQILVLLGQEAELAHLAGQYAKWTTIGLYPQFIYECLRRYLQGQGIMQASFYVTLVASPINMLLQWLLVWSPVGIGYIGSPIAGAITYCLLPIFTLAYIAFVDGKKAWGGWDWKEALDVSQIVEFIKLGAPGVAMVCSEWWAFEIITLATGLLGDSYLAAQAVVLNTCSLMYMIPQGISIAATTRIGNALGANCKNRARLDAWTALSIGLMIGCFNSTILFLIREKWGYLWNNDPEVVKLIAEILPLGAMFQISDGIGVIAGGILRGCGRQHIGAYINLAGYYALGIPLSLLLAFRYNLELVGLWIGLTVGLFVVSIIQILIISRTDWEEEARRARERVRSREYDEQASSSHTSYGTAPQGSTGDVEDHGVGSSHDPLLVVTIEESD